MDNNIIDYGEWVIPTSWHDITLDMFSDIERYYEDKSKNFDIREVLHIITGKSQDEINALPAEFLEVIMEKLMFLYNTKPDVGENSNKIVIDGVTYIDGILIANKTYYAVIIA